MIEENKGHVTIFFGILYWGDIYTFHVGKTWAKPTKSQQCRKLLNNYVSGRVPSKHLQDAGENAKCQLC